MPIYFMRPIHVGTIKIGYSDDIQERRKRLQRHYGCRLRILATIEGGYEKEQEIFQRFKHLRVGLTEQFRPAPELMEFIGHPRVLDEDLKAARPMEVSGSSRRRTPPTLLKVTYRRNIGRRVEDEEQLKKIVLDELERLSRLDVERAFVLPSVTIIAKRQDEKEFATKARLELGKWHRWLASVLGAGNVRRWSRMMSEDDYMTLISGFFIYDGFIENFSQFEKQFKVRIQRGTVTGNR
jgi:hypothetical protein